LVIPGQRIPRIFFRVRVRNFLGQEISHQDQEISRLNIYQIFSHYYQIFITKYLPNIYNTPTKVNTPIQTLSTAPKTKQTMSINSKIDNNHSGDFLDSVVASFAVNQDPAQLKKSGIVNTPYSQNWPGHLTENLPRNKRCKNEKCKCKQKSNRAYECWVCGAEFPTTKATKRKYFSKNNPEPEGAKKKRRKKNELARAKKSPVSSLAIIGSSAPKKTPKVAAVQNEPVDDEDFLFSNVFNDPVMLDEPAMDLDNVPVAEISSLPKLSRGDSLTPLPENEAEFNYDSIPLPDFDSFQNMYDSDGGIEFDPIALFSGDIDFDLSV